MTEIQHNRPAFGQQKYPGLDCWIKSVLCWAIEAWIATDWRQINPWHTWNYNWKWKRHKTDHTDLFPTANRRNTAKSPIKLWCITRENSYFFRPIINCLVPECSPTYPTAPRPINDLSTTKNRGENFWTCSKFSSRQIWMTDSKLIIDRPTRIQTDA